MDVRPLVFADDADRRPRLYACGACGLTTSPKFYGGGERGAAEALRRAEACCVPPPAPPVRHCACGAELPYAAQQRCGACKDAAVIAAAEVVDAPSGPVVIVGTDTFFHDVDEAWDAYPGTWVHPCDSIRLHVHPSRLAARLVEQACEDMCEEAFEDAGDSIEGSGDLEEAFEAALTAFNAVQTASTWMPDVGKVYRLPDAPTEAEARG